MSEIVAAARQQGPAADTIIARYFKTRRYAGSKDRRAIRDIVYEVIRAYPDPPADAAGAVALVAARLSEEPEASAFPASATPAWLATALARSGLDAAELAALNARAPLDLRVNRARATLDEVITAFPGAERVPHLPNAIRVPRGTPVETHPLYVNGGFEVQDAGSQAVTLASAAVPGSKVIDLCAGAGGKTLALAALMDNQGCILASDSDRQRLSRLQPRAERAGVSIVETRLLNPGRELDHLEDWRGAADLVLIDAPCSGSGTWRRNPEARWRLNPAALERLVATQARLMRVAAALVRPGGAIVYIVCSLLHAEGSEQMAGFLAEHPTWQTEPLSLPLGRPHGLGWRLTPGQDSTDGFFVARMRAPC